MNTETKRIDINSSTQNQRLWIQLCLFFVSWGLFTLNISLGKKLSQEGQVWGHQSGRVNFFWQCFRKNFNCGQYMDDKHFFLKQISDNLLSVCDQNYPVGYMSLPITAPSNKPWFWHFFKFSGKTWDIFLEYFKISSTT